MVCGPAGAASPSARNTRTFMPAPSKGDRSATICAPLSSRERTKTSSPWRRRRVTSASDRRSSSPTTKTLLFPLTAVAGRRATQLRAGSVILTVTKSPGRRPLELARLAKSNRPVKPSPTTAASRVIWPLEFISAPSKSSVTETSAARNLPASSSKRRCWEVLTRNATSRAKGSTNCPIFSLLVTVPPCKTVTLAKSPEKVARTTVSRRLRSASAREISIRITRARA